jgi:hypothetical protein
MATTTPNFGWAVPTSTDLVKDGAVAIETLGDSIDASMVDLKGGTTGQVLKKNSNTDMDFVWGADSAGMTNPMTTTGDTIYSSSGSTPARLGIGTTGQILTVASGIPSWATPAASASGLNLITPTSIANSGGSASLSGALVSASGVTSVSVNGVFSSTYTNYLIQVYELVLNGGSVGISMRMRASGTDTSGSSYKYGSMYSLFTGATLGSGGTAGGSDWDICGATATGENASTIFIQNPQASKNTTFQATETRYDASAFAGGRLENTTSYDGFTIFIGSANLNTKIRVYGLSN